VAHAAAGAKLADGQYRGGWGDDFEMWRGWMSILVGFEDPVIEAAQGRLSRVDGPRTRIAFTLPARQLCILRITPAGPTAEPASESSRRAAAALTRPVAPWHREERMSAKAVFGG